MLKYTCPNCGKRIERLAVRPSKAKYRWYEVSRNHTFCPHCDIQLTLDRTSQRWLLLTMPFMLLALWNAVRETHGGIGMWVAMGLGTFGVAMFAFKSRLVIVGQGASA